MNNPISVITLVEENLLSFLASSLQRERQVSNRVSKCGIDCGACPWGPYPRKDMTSEDFEHYKNNAKRILGYMPIKTPCVTCQTSDADIPKESRLPNRKCLIRQCVDKARIPNCAYCSRFPCDTLNSTAGVWNRQSIESKLGSSISDEEYHLFVEPFEGISRLGTVRESLKPDEIVEPIKVQEAETRIVAFPEDLSLKEHLAPLKEVHRLLADLERSSLGLRDADTFAQHHKLENQKAHIFRFLWILGNCGRLEREGGKTLFVDAETYQANRGNEKTLSIRSFVEDVVFKSLAEFGVCCELFPLKGVNNEDLTTGTGYLRKRDWIMGMSFEERIGGATTLKALQTYANKLERRYGSRAFQRFRRADMQVMSET